MSKILVLVIFVVVSVTKCTAVPEETQTAEFKAKLANLAMLKLKMNEHIRKGQQGYVPVEDDLDPLEAKSLRVGPITPVSRLRNKHKTTENKPKPGLRSVMKTVEDKMTTTHNSKILTQKPTSDANPQLSGNTWAKHVKIFGNSRDIFYRRDTRKKRLTEADIKSRHALLCMDLLRPIIDNLKKNGTRKIVSENMVNRLIQLLSYGSSQSPDEIESILYQINNLHLRFFQWEVTSIKKLFNFIMPNQKHSFKSLKHGVKRILFDMWHMDLSNTTLLVKESRMFRPPCLGTSEGSTRTSPNPMLITKPKPLKTTCPPKDKQCREQEELQSSSSYEN